MVWWGVSDTIVIVEDDPDVQFMLSLAVELLLGTQSALESNATDAFDRIKNARPHLVLLDTALADALLLLKQLKSNPETRSIPVIGINSRGLLTCAEAIREGFDACFQAGEIDDLSAKAKEYLEQRPESGKSSSEE